MSGPLSGQRDMPSCSYAIDIPQTTSEGFQHADEERARRARVEDQ